MKFGYIFANVPPFVDAYQVLRNRRTVVVAVDAGDNNVDELPKLMLTARSNMSTFGPHQRYVVQAGQSLPSRAHRLRYAFIIARGNNDYRSGRGFRYAIAGIKR